MEEVWEEEWGVWEVWGAWEEGEGGAAHITVVQGQGGGVEGEI